MGRPKRLYPLGKYRLRTPKVVDKEKAYPVELEYTWNRQIIRKTTNVFVKVADWNQNGNQGRGEIRASHGGESKRLNQLLLARISPRPWLPFWFQSATLTKTFVVLRITCLFQVYSNSTG